MGDSVDCTEAAGLEDFCFEHEVGRDVDDRVVGGVVELLEFGGHSFGSGGAVGNGLKKKLSELKAMTPRGELLRIAPQFSRDLLYKCFALQ